SGCCDCCFDMSMIDSYSMRPQAAPCQYHLRYNVQEPLAWWALLLVLASNSMPLVHIWRNAIGMRLHCPCLRTGRPFAVRDPIGPGLLASVSLFLFTLV